ncbi:MAG: hypothetical protein U0802_14010 [Candidatus Binatia bacterium]
MPPASPSPSSCSATSAAARVRYHALALADAGARVDLIGLAGREPLAAVRTQPAIRVHRLPDAAAPRAAAGAAYLAGAARRALAQAGALRRAARRRRRAVILAQTPPALPTLAVALRAARRGGRCLVLDWHNLGHALLALRLGPGHPVVRAAALARERRLGRRAARRAPVRVGGDARGAAPRLGHRRRPAPRPARAALRAAGGRGARGRGARPDAATRLGGRQPAPGAGVAPSG